MAEAGQIEKEPSIHASSAEEENQDGAEEEEEENDILKEKLDKERRMAKLAAPPGRIICATYEAFHDILGDDQAARMKRKVDYIQRKPLEQIEQILAAERSQRLQRVVITKPHLSKPVCTKTAELNGIFVKMLPLIEKSVCSAADPKVQREKLTENQQRLVTYGITQIENILLNNSKIRMYKAAEKKVHERLACRIAEWMEGILVEMTNEALDPERQKSTERLTEQINQKLI